MLNITNMPLWRETAAMFNIFLCKRTGYCYGVISYKAFHALRPFSDLLCSRVLIIPGLSTEFSALVAAETPISDAV
jgi:hypothetical protein